MYYRPEESDEQTIRFYPFPPATIQGDSKIAYIKEIVGLFSDYRDYIPAAENLEWLGMLPCGHAERDSSRRRCHLVLVLTRPSRLPLLASCLRDRRSGTRAVRPTRLTRTDPPCAFKLSQGCRYGCALRTRRLESSLAHRRLHGDGSVDPGSGRSRVGSRKRGP